MGPMHAPGPDPLTHAPHGVPAFWVVVGHAETELGVHGKAAVGREEADGGRLEWVLRWEDELAVVEASLQGMVGEVGEWVKWVSG